MDQDQMWSSAPETADAKAEWIPPEVDRMVAGGAEGAADISVDGVDIPS